MRKVDLNLFRVFAAVMKHRSISLASNELHLTPSATSHALTRLRNMLADPLFIAGEQGMEPTARALELAPHVQAALSHIDAALDVKAFDPARSTRCFRIAATDYGSVTILPRLIARLATLAPYIDIRVFPFNRPDTIRQLEDGRVDLALSWFDELPATMQRLAIWRDQETIIARPHHPLAQHHGVLSQEQLLAYPHVVVELTGNGDTPLGYSDDRGVMRRVWMEHLLLDVRQDSQISQGRVAVSVPHFAAVLPIIAVSDMLATLPYSYVEPAIKTGTVAQLQLPYEPLVAHIEAIWLERRADDAELQWLLNELQQIHNP